MFHAVQRFVREVRGEFNKIVWPTWSETKLTTIIVLVIGVLVAAYFLIVDQVIYRILALMLGY